MANAREAVNKVLDKLRSDVNDSNKQKFEKDFAAFLQAQGLVVDDGNFLIFLHYM